MPIQPDRRGPAEGGIPSLVRDFRSRGEAARCARNGHARTLVCLFGAILVCLIGTSAPVDPTTAEPLPRSVLVFDQSEPNSPWGNDFRAALRSTLNEAPGAPIAVYTEILDLGRFNWSRDEQLLRTFLGGKYRDKPIGVIVVHGSEAVRVLARLRGELWPTVPIVFVAMGAHTAPQSVLPAEATGAIVRLSLRNAITAARALVPGLRRVALVGDPWELQPFFGHFKQELQEFTADLTFMDLLGLPMAQIEARVAALPDDAAIVYTPIYVDGAGVTYVPREALRAVAAAANRPIVVNVEPQIGVGGAGGFVAFPKPVGRDAARRVLRILEGEPASQIPITVGDFARPVFDWRQLQRFAISESQLPPGSEVRFRPPSLWQQHRTDVIGAFGVVALQALLIFGLLVERQRRRAAQVESHRRLVELTYLNRTAAAGAMSASIAHELNQPLAAILSNAEAAELLLSANPIDLPLLKEILADIRQSDQRAAAIIAGLRGLLKRKEDERQTVNLCNVIRDAVDLLNAEAKTHAVEMSVDCGQSALFVRADPVHLEQVLLNLGLNAMQAMPDNGSGERRIAIEAVPTGKSTVEVSVSDTGPGIPADHIKKVFDPFFTTKPHGTGLGLSIVQTILEAYGGRIWADNKSGGGAVFHFMLPLAY